MAPQVRPGQLAELDQVRAELRAVKQDHVMAAGVITHLVINGISILAQQAEAGDGGSQAALRALADSLRPYLEGTGPRIIRPRA